MKGSLPGRLLDGQSFQRQSCPMQASFVRLGLGSTGKFIVEATTLDKVRDFPMTTRISLMLGAIEWRNDTQPSYINHIRNELYGVEVGRRHLHVWRKWERLHNATLPPFPPSVFDLAGCCMWTSVVKLWVMFSITPESTQQPSTAR